MEKSIHIRKNTFAFYLFLSISVLFTVCREVCMAGAVKGISFCIATLIPAVFPFTVVCKLLVKAGVISRFGVISSGLVCGAPSGAYMCTEMYKNGYCTKHTAEHLCAVTNGMTPTFVIGFVGVCCLNNAQKGVFVYLICSFSSILYAFVVKKRIRITVNRANDISVFSAFTESVTDGISAVISLSGFTVFFFVICEFLNTFFVFLPSHTLSFIFLFCELITGILQSAPLCAVLSERVFFSLMCAFTSFSGICIHLQVRGVLSRTGLSFRPFFTGKCVMAFISFIISFIFYGIIFG